MSTTTKEKIPDPTPLRIISRTPALRINRPLIILEYRGCEANFMAHNGLWSHRAFLERLYKSRNAAKSKNIMVLYISVINKPAVESSTDWLLESITE
ncbi:hypothetical protein IWX76_000442 [Pedobacter sp. CAN_A7]|uniref:hypothetical protein n=1 Tax=Pedobacter sp. CAN_A7 TaxID=2787722 RepID=UPI0018CA03C4